nr:ATP-binding cassette domain-containing protein [uncultured Porphyromonas sp.]
MSTILRLEDASIGYSDTLVLEHFDWSIQRGERWAITGPNGCGKTTLMRTLLRLIPLRGGGLRCFDRVGQETSDLVMSYLPQINQIDRHFPIRVWEVIDSGLPKTLRDPKARREERSRLAEAVGVHELLDNPIGRLSGGQLQRTLLARALASQPELLILDEPLSFLDRAYKQSFQSLLTELVPQDATLLIVTHDMTSGAGEEWHELQLGQD